MNVINFWLDFLLPILSIIIPVFATLYTVNNRIKNQNRENHQPYVVLDSIVDIDKINELPIETKAALSILSFACIS